MSRLKLSKNLLQMKFMQKTKEELEENQDAQLFNQNHDYLAKKQKYQFEPSYQYFENLKFGRTSYKSMNLEIEKLQEEFASLSNGGKSINTAKSEQDADAVEITDEQMADYYRQSRSKGTSNNKNKRKRGSD